MAKIIIAGEAVVVKSTLTLDQINMVKKYRPEALVLLGGEDNKEPVFAVDTTTGCGDISKFGASFGAESHDEDKNAIITMIARNVDGDIREWIADKIGPAVMLLGKLEEKLPGVIAEIEAERLDIMASIEVAE